MYISCGENTRAIKERLNTLHMSAWKWLKLLGFLPPSLKDVLILQKIKLIQAASVIASLPDDLNCEPDDHALSVQEIFFFIDKENTRLLLKLSRNHFTSIKLNKLESFLTKAEKDLQEYIHLHKNAELLSYLDGSAVRFNINNISSFHSFLLQAFKYAWVQLETNKHHGWSKQFHIIMVMEEEKLRLKLTPIRQN